MVGLSYLFKAPSTLSKRKWVNKFEEIQKKLRDLQTNRYTLSNELYELIITFFFFFFFSISKMCLVQSGVTIGPI